MKTEKNFLCAVLFTTTLMLSQYAAADETTDSNSNVEDTKQTNAVSANENPATYDLGKYTITANRIRQSVETTPASVSVITGAQIEQKGFKTLGDALSSGVLGMNVNTYGGLSGKAVPYLLGTDEVLILVDGKRQNLPQGIGTGKGGVDINTLPLGDNIARIEIVNGGNSALYGSDAVGGVINIITKKGSSSGQSSVMASIGSNSGYRYNINLQGSEDKYSWYASGQTYGDSGQRPNSAAQDKNFSLRIDRTLDKQSTLTLDYSMITNHNDMPGPTVSPTSGDYSNVLQHSWSLGYNRKHDDNLSMNIRYYYTSQTNSGYNLGYFNNRDTMSVFEYQDSARTNDKNLWTWGGEQRQERVTSTAEGTSAHTGTNTAFYLQNQYDMYEKLTMTTGLRYDNNSIYGKNLSPKVAFLYRANQKTNLYANWGGIFKAPNFDDLYSVTAYGAGNPNLKAEKGWTAEVGVKQQFSKDTGALFSVFKRNIYDAIRWMPDSTGWYWQPQNIDNLVTTGLNVAFNHKLSKTMSMDLGYTYLDSVNENTNSSVGDPHNTFFINLNHKVGKWQSTLGGTYTGPHDLGINAVGGYFITNFSTKYSIADNTDLLLQANNLFNRWYQPQQWYPAPGFNMNFSIKQYF